MAHWTRIMPFAVFRNASPLPASDSAPASSRMIRLSEASLTRRASCDGKFDMYMCNSAKAFSRSATGCTWLKPHNYYYVTSGTNTNECPDGSAKISSKADCQTAAMFTGHRWWLNVAMSEANKPGGCFIDNTDAGSPDKVYFNTHTGQQGGLDVTPRDALGGNILSVPMCDKRG